MRLPMLAAATFALAAAGAALAQPLLVAPPGMTVTVALEQGLDSETAVTGQSFSIYLAEPLIIDGQVALPAKTRGEGQVVHASKSNRSGSAGELVLAARYLEHDGRTILLSNLHLSAAGTDHGFDNVLGVGLAGAVNSIGPAHAVPNQDRGQRAILPAGTRARAEIGREISLVSLGSAPSTAAPSTELAPAGPPRGKAIVVFFRPPEFATVLDPCTIHENGKPIGRLGHARHFQIETTPGPHTYTVKSERTDKLPMELADGTINYIQCSIQPGMFLRQPNIAPSTYAAYAAVLPKLKPMERPTP